MKFKRIAIIGIGLMGGSLAAAIRRKFPSVHVTGISRNAKALALARREGWAHQVTQDLQEGVRDADLIVLCTPVDTFRALLLKIDQAAKAGALVTDAGSVKEEIVRWTDRRKFKNIHFIGAHPMAGSHAKGAPAAQRNLYDKALTFVVRSPKSCPGAFAAVRNFWRQLCARVSEVSAAQHDGIVAEISHLPHALAVCLTQCVDPRAFKYAATGFADVTRIAQGHPSIWLPIFLANRKNIFSALDRFEKEIRLFKKALKDKDSRLLVRILSRAAKKRAQISL